MHPLRKPLALALALVLVVLGVAVKFAAANAFGFGPADAQRFELAPFGSPISDTTPPVFLTWSRGDGMAFFSLANDMNADGPARNLPPDPAYRMTRLGYSLATRVVSLVPGVSVAVALTVVNLAALGGLGLLSSRLISRLGDRALLLYLNPAIWYAVAFDTAEALGILFVLIAACSSAPVTLAGAALLGITRPSLAVALPSTPRPIASTVIAGSTAIGLQVWVSIIGIQPTDGAGNLTYPLAGYYQAMPSMALGARIVAAVVLVAAAFAVRRSVTGKALDRGPRLALLGVGLLTLMLAPQVVDRPENLLRATAALPIVLTLTKHSLAPHGRANE